MGVCVLLYQKMDNYHLSQIITWLQLNRASLSVTQQMLVVIKHGVDVWMCLFSSTRRISAQQMVYASQFS